MFLQPHANFQHHSSYGLAGMLLTSNSARRTDTCQVITKSLSEQSSGETKRRKTKKICLFNYIIKRNKVLSKTLICIKSAFLSTQMVGFFL